MHGNKQRRPDRKVEAPFFLSMTLILEAYVLRRSNAKCAEYQVYESVSREHDKHAEESVENPLLPSLSASVRRLRVNELEDAEEKDKKRNGKKEQDYRVEYILVDLIQKLRNCHMLTLKVRVLSERL